MNYIDNQEDYRKLSLDEKVRLRPDRNIGLLNLVNQKLYVANQQYNQSLKLNSEPAQNYYSREIDKYQKVKRILTSTLSMVFYNRGLRLENAKHKVQENILGILTHHDPSFKLEKSNFSSSDLIAYTMFWHKFKDDEYKETTFQKELSTLRSIEREIHEVERLLTLFRNTLSIVDNYGKMNEIELSEDVVRLPNHVLLTLIRSIVEINNLENEIVKKNNSKPTEYFADKNPCVSVMMRTLSKIKARSNIVEATPIPKKIAAYLKNVTIGFVLGVPPKLSTLSANFNYTLATKTELSDLCSYISGLFHSDYCNYKHSKTTREKFERLYVNLLEVASIAGSLIDEDFTLSIYSYKTAQKILPLYIEKTADRRTKLKKYISKPNHTLNDKFAEEQKDFILSEKHIKIELPTGNYTIGKEGLINIETGEVESLDILKLYDYDQDNELFTNLKDNTSFSYDEWLTQAVLRENEY